MRSNKIFLFLGILLVCISFVNAYNYSVGDFNPYLCVNPHVEEKDWLDTYSRWYCDENVVGFMEFSWFFGADIYLKYMEVIPEDFILTNTNKSIVKNITTYNLPTVIDFNTTEHYTMWRCNNRSYFAHSVSEVELNNFVETVVPHVCSSYWFEIPHNAIDYFFENESCFYVLGQSDINNSEVYISEGHPQVMAETMDFFKQDFGLRWNSTKKIGKIFYNVYIDPSYTHYYYAKGESCSILVIDSGNNEDTKEFISNITPSVWFDEDDTDSTIYMMLLLSLVSILLFIGGLFVFIRIRGGFNKSSKNKKVRKIVRNKHKRASKKTINKGSSLLNQTVYGRTLEKLSTWHIKLGFNKIDLTDKILRVPDYGPANWYFVFVFIPILWVIFLPLFLIKMINKKFVTIPLKEIDKVEIVDLPSVFKSKVIKLTGKPGWTHYFQPFKSRWSKIDNEFTINFAKKIKNAIKKVN